MTCFRLSFIIYFISHFYLSRGTCEECATQAICTQVSSSVYNCMCKVGYTDWSVSFSRPGFSCDSVSWFSDLRQQATHTDPSGVGGGEFGMAAAALGDLNDDGTVDWAVQGRLPEGALYILFTAEDNVDVSSYTVIDSGAE
eukprot:Rmarinus@m.3568